MRSSLQVAPLAIQKSRTGSDNGSIKSDHTITAHPYTSTQMTPPTTPNGSQEDFHAQSSAPTVFHNFLRAFYPFHPSYAMTDSTVTLPLNEGDVILVHSIHTNGWADGTLLVSGARGWLPTNYCEAYDPEEMGNLLKALLNFWDLLRSTAVNDSEIFGNQEFMKGIIAGVRYLLERTNCLTRESAIIQRHDGLRRGRKSLLSELSSLVKTAKRLQEHQKMPNPYDDVNDIIDEMILKAFKIVTKGVRFLDVLEEDRRLRAPAVAVMATVLEETAIPPTPPADTVAFEDNQSQTRDAGTRSDGSGLAASLGPSALGEATQTTAPTNKRLSAVYASGSSPRRVSQGTLLPVNRMSTTISHRVSLAGPSPLSRPQNLVSERLTSSHDTFLSYLGSFIGRLHLQSQSRPHLALAIKQSATSGGELLVVVDVVCAHSPLTKELLEQPRAAMYDRIVDLVHAARDILLNTGPDVADVIMPQDNSRLLYAATGCVKATGECVAKTKWVIERIGDFEFEFDIGSLGIDIDLSVLDIVEEERERPMTAVDSASIAESSASSSAVSEPSATSTQVSAQAPNATPRPTVLSIDKPLPEVPQMSQSEEVTPVPKHRLSTSSRPQSLVPSDSTPSLVSPGSSARPSLPPLPKLTTTLLPQEDYSPSDHSGSHDSGFRNSFRPESMAGSISGTGSSYLSRDSESSLVSQISTRASTPDHTLAPKNQPSLSELSTAGSATLAEEVEEVESKLLEKTYAHELMFNKEGQVTGGSLPALVERLTTHESTPDAMFVSTFYLTFRLFCTPIKLAEALIDRFDYVGDSPHMASPVRLRVYNVFKGWLETHWRDETDRDALVLIEPFAEFNLTAVLPSAGKRLLELAQRVSSSDGTLVPRMVSSMGKTNTSISQYIPIDTPLPAPNLSKSQAHALTNWKSGGSCPTVLDFDPLEIARQLTIKQMHIFCAIMPEELLGSQWMKKGGVGSPNVKAMTALSTDLSNLVADTILYYNEVKKRAAVIKQWIKVAHQCLELHNYDALMAIICSLNSSTITRLRKTWDVISPKRRELLKTLQAIVEPSQNNKVLRARLHDHVPPCLPFQGMFLTDLTFVDIGNPATKQLPGADGTSDLTVVNFDKHTRTAKIIGELQRFQIPYRLTELPDLQEWIQGQITRVRELDNGNNVQVSYYRKSLLLEPRETQALRTPIEGPAGPNGQKADLFGWMRGGGDKSAAVI